MMAQSDDNNQILMIQLTLSQSQVSQQSVDSSQVLSNSSSFKSTQSFHLQPSPVQLKLNDTNQNNNVWSPIQLPRFGESKRQSDLFGKFQQQFVGFVGLGKKDKGKAILINQSKLKKAKEFMDLNDQVEFNVSAQKTIEAKKAYQNLQIDSDSTQSIGDIRDIIKKQTDFGQNQFQFPDFSLGFKSLGTGKAIKISQQYTNRVKLLFNDFEASQDQIKTKLQKISPQSKQSPKFTNFAKTQKIKPLPQSKSAILNIKKPAVARLSEDRKLLDCILTKIGDKYQNIKLKDLKQIPKQQIKKLANYWKQEKQKFNKSGIEHKKQKCQVKWCYFCKKYQKQKIIVNRQFILQQLSKLLPLQDTTKTRLVKIIDLNLLKLLKYTFFDKNIQNKQLNPNNLLLQLYKKSLLLQKQIQSPLQSSVSTIISSNGKNLGKHITLMILDIAYAEQMDIYFVQLSDGWYSVYAIITSTNQLYHLIDNKLLVGTKLSIVNWSVHPVSNVLQFHPNKQVANIKAVCIEINYNNSMPTQFWLKLGWPKQVFYRPVSKCKQSGGSIPLIQGIIIRMFTIKNNKNIISSYLQILLNQGTCMLMKVTLSEQISLVQLFRLYYCYHFLRVKKISSTLLQFVANSKFYEIQDKQRMQKVKDLFKNRLLNVNLAKNIFIKNQNKRLNINNSQIYYQQHDQQKTNGNNLYSNTYSNTNLNPNMKKNYLDIVTKNAQIRIGSTKIKIDQKIQGVVLLQQYTISNNTDGIILSRGDRGSCLRRIPKIYQQFQYDVL